MFDSANREPLELPQKEEPQALSPNPPAKPKPPIEVHTMPMKFHTRSSAQSPNAKLAIPGKKNNVGKIVLIVVVVVVILGLGVVGYLFLQKKSTPANTNIQENLNSNISLNYSNGNTSGNENVNSNTNTNSNSNAATNENSNTNANANANTNSAVVRTPFDQLASSQDLDADGLTDVEEAAYGTSKTTADSDGDGFIDGTEVRLGYSPTAKTKLLDSPKVASYTNATYGFTLLYPSEWTLQRRGGDDKIIVFIAKDGDETVEVSVSENLTRLTPLDWYLQQSPSVSSSSVQTVINWSKTVQGVKSVDGLSAYFGSGNYIYALFYDVQKKTKVDFKTTFLMMTGSIELIPPTSLANLNANTNTSSNTNTNTNSNVNTNSITVNTNTNSNANTNTNTSNTNVNANTNTANLNNSNQ